MRVCLLFYEAAFGGGEVRWREEHENLECDGVGIWEIYTKIFWIIGRWLNYRNLPSFEEGGESELM